MAPCWRFWDPLWEGCAERRTEVVAVALSGWFIVVRGLNVTVLWGRGEGLAVVGVGGDISGDASVCEVAIAVR